MKWRKKNYIWIWFVKIVVVVWKTPLNNSTHCVATVSIENASVHSKKINVELNLDIEEFQLIDKSLWVVVDRHSAYDSKHCEHICEIFAHDERQTTRWCEEKSTIFCTRDFSFFQLFASALMMIYYFVRKKMFVYWRRKPVSIAMQHYTKNSNIGNISSSSSAKSEDLGKMRGEQRKKNVQ